MTNKLNNAIPAIIQYVGKIWNGISSGLSNHSVDHYNKYIALNKVDKKSKTFHSNEIFSLNMYLTNIFLDK